MRIVTVTIPGGFHHQSSRALLENWPGLHDLKLIPPDDPKAYQRILTSYWEIGESFCVVEPDIVIRPDVAEAILNCDCEYGCFPYPWLTDIGPALGCTWFRSSFIEKHPTVMKEVAAQNITWRQLDVVLMRHILARKYKEQPHVHLPPVEHLNPEKQLMPGASSTPLTTVPNW